MLSESSGSNVMKRVVEHKEKEHEDAPCTNGNRLCDHDSNAVSCHCRRAVNYSDTIVMYSTNKCSCTTGYRAVTVHSMCTIVLRWRSHTQKAWHGGGCGQTNACSHNSGQTANRSLAAVRHVDTTSSVQLYVQHAAAYCCCCNVAVQCRRVALHPRCRCCLFLF